MRIVKASLLTYLVLAVLFTSILGLITSKMAKKRWNKEREVGLKSDNGPNITTSCNLLDFSKVYNYTGIVASGYLTVGKGNSALAYTFYGQKDVRQQSQLRNYPTILWLNGGPGSSSQTGNLQEIGPLLLIKKYELFIQQNNYTWANKYNLLFIDQPVGTGLSYADPTFPNAFVKSMDEVASDFYRALYELYNGKGCFSSLYFSIPASNPLFIFG